MMKKIIPVLFSFIFFLAIKGFGQQWPVTITMENGQLLKMYKPQPSSFSNNRMNFQSAVSLNSNSSEEPIFGMVWASANTRESGKGDQLEITSLKISELRFPASVREETSEMVESALESRLPAQLPNMARAEVDESIQMNRQKQSLDKTFSNKAPAVLYRSHSAMLVLIDGDPIWQRNEDWGVEAVVNSPNTIIKTENGQYYIWGAQNWYRSHALNGPYTFTTQVPDNFRQIEAALAAAAKSDAEQEQDFTAGPLKDPVEEVIVRNSPAELIQTDGKASFSPVPQTHLLYVDNSPNDIFMDVNSQQYYILLAGRWFSAGSLNAAWSPIASDKLPADFARIPEGSPKDNVLPSVAGTEAARNALLDAQVPQTARVNRATATASVSYDGEPEFESISGTQLAYARNSSISVLRYNRQYYLVDNGIWFQSNAPGGPWVASQYRPAEVDLIPPSYPVYSVKYVYIYDVTPQYIYTGYTPGYLNTFICGPTIVYGTGYYYRPWHRRYYYPRPFSWGFNMVYRPWFGWSFGINFSSGWYSGAYFGYPAGTHGCYGWWGPTRYRPAYCAPVKHYNGYYGYRNIPSNNCNNVYRGRTAIYTSNYRPIAAPQRHYSSRPPRLQSQPNHNRPNPGQIQGSNANGRPEVNHQTDRQRPSRQYNPLPSRENPSHYQGNDRNQTADHHQLTDSDHKSSRPAQGIYGRTEANPARNQAGPQRNQPSADRPQGNAGRVQENVSRSQGNDLRNQGNGRSDAERAALYRSQSQQQPQRSERTERPQISERMPSRSPQPLPSRGQQQEGNRPERRGRN